MDSLKTEVILAGLADVIGQLAWYEDIAVKREELKDAERIKTLQKKALELSNSIRINGADSIDGLEERYKEIRKEYDGYFEKYNQIVQESVKQFDGQVKV
ncbi:hypothetical protein C3L23_09335 [Nautilia sp. PV-1]|uniref:hypothetical protein n=1 Tax=Nautilia sp. PV-1 TaxID=2579250 RepID=UPI000FD7999F|nr:hypothetical protein [Nautilia sp. PV-1]AZV47458.1 hypothetical protein C3L23_09335 [Nautilia sp. PV-1]